MNKNNNKQFKAPKVSDRLYNSRQNTNNSDTKSEASSLLSLTKDNDLLSEASDSSD